MFDVLRHGLQLVPDLAEASQTHLFIAVYLKMHVRISPFELFPTNENRMNYQSTE
jgi:hypothetical protein